MSLVPLDGVGYYKICLLTLSHAYFLRVVDSCDALAIRLTYNRATASHTKHPTTTSSLPMVYPQHPLAATDAAFILYDAGLG